MHPNKWEDLNAPHHNVTEDNTYKTAHVQRRFIQATMIITTDEIKQNERKISMLIKHIVLHHFCLYSQESQADKPVLIPHFRSLIYKQIISLGSCKITCYLLLLS